jgi:alkanesulfonate monooxygenase SsuD/methylene tetrahydromethanopterin reductase-like flavin-dependent oxidoreductase (luciferase family)
VKIALDCNIPTLSTAGSVSERYEQIYETMEYVNDKGFSAAWITEHHFTDYALTPNPLMLLTEAARRAPDLRLGTSVLVLPLWHPLRLAEDVALLDILSGGRVEFGIGRGYSPHQFGAFGQDLRNNRDQFNECLNIVMRAWTEDDFEYEGRFWKIPPVTVYPKPLQAPHPPIWMAATTPPSIRNAIERGFHLCTGSGAVVEELRQRTAYIDSILHSMNRPLASVENQANRFVFCSTSQDEIDMAIEEARWQIRVSRATTYGPGGTWIYPPKGLASAALRPAPSFVGEPTAEDWQRRMVIGNPDECIRRLKQLADAGVSYIFGMFSMGMMPHESTINSVKLFAKEVVPALSEMEPIHVGVDELEAIKNAYVEVARRGEVWQGP